MKAEAGAMCGESSGFRSGAVPFARRICYNYRGAHELFLCAYVFEGTDSMYEVRVTADFAAAHFLEKYNGKCERLHGHNYKVYAHVRGECLDEGGMLLDFARLKSALRAVCARLDHTNLNDMPVFQQNPSAERIAQYIFNGIIERAAEDGIDLRRSPEKAAAWLYAVDVFETETSRARYTAG